MSDPHSQTAPAPDGGAVPDRMARAIGLLHTLIAYGKHLIGTVHQRAAGPDFLDFATVFGTTDTNLIVNRIRCGLCRALALLDRLERLAARGKDLEVRPMRMPSARPALAAPSGADGVGGIAADAATADPPVPAGRRMRVADPRQARLPTEAEIVADVRRRPIGAVLGDICLELGIVSSHPLMRDISPLMMVHDGNFIVLMEVFVDRIRAVMDALTPEALDAHKARQIHPGEDQHAALWRRASAPWPWYEPGPVMGDPIAPPPFASPQPAATGPP